MPTKMIACPHCGAMNSDRKQTCFECREDLQAPKPAVPARFSAPKAAAPSSFAPTPAPLATPMPAAPPVEAPDISATEAPAPTPAPIQRVSAAARNVAKQTTAEILEMRTRPIVFGVRLRERAQFYRQLQHLIKSGIPVGMALNYLEQSVAPGLRPMTREMTSLVQSGGMLSDGMARHTATFPEWEVSMVMAGEKGGTLTESMEAIADALEAEMQLRSGLVWRMLPIFGVIGFFVPTMLIVAGTTAISKAMETGGEQAAMGAAVALVISALVRTLQVFLACCLIFAAWRIWGRSRRGARIQQAIISRLPLIGPILQNTMRLRFARVLGALWNAGLSPMESLETAGRAVGNPALVLRIKDLLPRLSQGAPLSEIIAETNLFRPESLYLVQSGETSGTIGASLEKVAEYYELEVNEQLRTLPERLQIIMYVLISLGVGYMAVKVWGGYASQLMGIMDEIGK